MSPQINDGGPAFPMQEPSAIHAYAIARLDGIVDTEERDRVYARAKAEAIGGMSLRAHFAGQAMQAYLAGRNIGDGRDSLPSSVAESCVRYADALIAELNRPKEDEAKHAVHVLISQAIDAVGVMQEYTAMPVKSLSDKFPTTCTRLSAAVKQARLFIR